MLRRLLAGSRFLIVLYIVALGLYDLFIDDKLPMPSWLVIRDIDDLKEKLIGVVIVLLAVTFLSNVVTWNGNPNIVALGAAIGLVLLGLGYVGKNAAKHSNHTDVKHEEEERKNTQEK